MYDVKCDACHQLDEHIIRLADFAEPIACAWCGGECKRVLTTKLQVVPDIAPYKSILTGELIAGRRQHRDHLRDHNCIEVGNENPVKRAPPKRDRGEVRAALKDAYNHMRLTGRI